MTNYHSYPFRIILKETIISPKESHFICSFNLHTIQKLKHPTKDEKNVLSPKFLNHRNLIGHEKENQIHAPFQNQPKCCNLQLSKRGKIRIPNVAFRL